MDFCTVFVRGKREKRHLLLVTEHVVEIVSTRSFIQGCLANRVPISNVDLLQVTIATRELRDKLSEVGKELDGLQYVFKETCKKIALVNIVMVHDHCLRVERIAAFVNVGSTCEHGNKGNRDKGSFHFASKYFAI